MSKKNALPQREISKELADRHASLIRVQVKKKRKCLRCGKTFISTSAGHRRCGVCDQAIEDYSFKTEQVTAV